MTKIANNSTMINNTMNEEIIPPAPPKKPDEMSNLTVQGMIKIFDPETEETYVEKRA